MDEQKNEGGRPPHEPSEKERQQVRTLTGFGFAQTDVALVLQISAPTLRKHYQHELDTGHIEANAKVAGALFKEATAAKPNISACIFWLKTRAGWREDLPVRAEKAEEVGKKEQANRDAMVAQVGTGWESLLPPRGRVQ